MLPRFRVRMCRIPNSRREPGETYHLIPQVPANRAIRAATVIVLLAVHLGLCAQRIERPSTAVGESPLASYDVSKIDNINPVNGNIFLDLPLLSYPQVGKYLRLDFHIYLNSKNWFIDWIPSTFNTGQPHPPPQIQGNWALTFFQGAYVARTQAENIGVHVDSQISTGQNAWGDIAFTTSYYSNFMQDQSGARHYVSDFTSEACSNTGGGVGTGCPEQYGLATNSYPATDASGFPKKDGVTYLGNGNISDPNGNTITVSTSGTPGWTDTTGRYIPGTATGPGVPIPTPATAGDSYTFTDLTPGVPTNDRSHCPSGTQSARLWQTPPIPSGPIYFLCYSNFIYQTNFQAAPWGAGVSEVSGQAQLLSAVVLPNGTAYTFNYDQYLNISQLGLPSGAIVQYTWQPLAFASDLTNIDGGPAPPSTPITRAIKSKTVYPGGGMPSETWTYHWYLDSRNFNSNTYYPEWSVVTDPLGNDTEHEFGTPAAGSSLSWRNLEPFETSTSWYQGCSPHDTASDRTCASANPSLMRSDSYVLTSIVSGGAGPNTASARIIPAIDHTTVTTTIPSTSGTLVSKTVTQKSLPYGSCTVSDLEAGSWQQSSPPTEETYAPCYLLDQDQSVASYDYGSDAPGSLLRTRANFYLWTSIGNYQNAGLMDLVYKVTTTDGSGKLAAETDYGYDENNGSPQGTFGNQTSTTQVNQSGPSTGVQGVYDGKGQLTQYLDAKSNATNIAYACGDSLIQTVTNPLQQVTQYGFDCDSGLLSQVRDPNDLANGRQGTTFLYDGMRNPTSITRSDGSATSITYSYGYPTSVSKTISASPDPSIHRSTTYDGLLRPTQVTNPDGSTVETTYDLVGRVWTVTNPHTSSPSTSDGTMTETYDALGRSLGEKKQDGSATVVSYNGSSTLTADEAGNQWTRTSDALGRLTSVVEPNGGVTRYNYDALGNLKGITQAGLSVENSRTRSFNYDSLSQLLTTQNPETGIVCYGQWSNGNCVNGYDANGNPVSKTDARGISTTFSYDALNRLISKTYSDGTVGERYGYDGKGADGNPLGQPSLNSIGRLSQQSNFVNIASTFSYDPLGRISQVTQCIPTDCSYDISTSASYDLAGNMASLTYPDGRTVQNVWDSAGRLSNVNYLSWGTTNVNQPYFSESNGYDPAGHLIAGAFGNGVSMSAAYDNRERMINLAYGPTNGPLWSKQYAWTPNSNMQSATDLITGVQRQFGYDNLNRLTAAQDIFTNLAMPSSSNGGTGSSTTSGSGATETPGTVGAVPQWTNTDDSNLLTDIGSSDSSWYASYAVVAPNAAMAPDGSMTATTVTATSGSPDTYVNGYVSSPANYSLETMTGSVWLRSLSGAESINLYIVYDVPGAFQIAGSTQVQLTTQWKQFKVTGAVLGNNVTGLGFQIAGGGSLTTGGFIMWNPMFEDEGRSGSSVTNFAPYSQIMNGPTWTASQGSISTNTVQAPDGTNTGATLTANAGATDNFVLDTVHNPAPFSGVTMTGSIWMRVPSGTQQISMNLWDTGASGSGPIAYTVFTLTTAWQRFQISGVTQSALSDLKLQIGGGNTFVNGAVIYAWGAQLEMATTAGPYVATANAPNTMGTSLTNLLSYSQDPTQWVTGSVTVAGNSVAAPDGSMTAARLTGTSGDSAMVALAPDAGLYDGETLTASVYLKSESGQPTISIYPYSITNSGTQYFTPLSVTLSTTWQRFQITGALPNGIAALAFQIGGAGSFTTGEVVDIWGAQMEIAPQAGPYIATSALPVITGRALTNILPSSQMISGPDWTLGAGTVSANSAAAPDGTNTATTFTANAESGDSYLSAFVPNPSLYDGQTVTSSVYLRAISGTQNVNLYLINAGNQGWAIASQATLSLTTSWQRFSVTSSLQNGLQSLYLQIGGGGTVVGGQGYEIWGAQFNVGSAPAPYTPTPGSTTVYATGASGTPVTNGLNETYAYDSFGNMLQNGSFSTTYTANNQMYAYPYDAAGNLLSDRVTNSMTWDAESRISTVGGAKYLYDGDGNRVEKQGPSVTDTIYFGGKPIARLSGGQWTDLIYGPSGLLAEVPGTQAASPIYRVTDNLGTDVGSLLTNGNFVNPMDHSPFGQVISGSTSDPYFLTGKERDTESGLDYFGARYYGSSMGRFMSPDWAAKAEPVPYSKLDDPQTLNLYSYVRNNPLSGVDPDGHYFVVSAAMQQQVQQYISTLLRTPQGAATVNAIASSNLPVSFGLGTLPAVSNGNGTMSITAGTTVPVPGSTPGAIGGASVTLDNANISTIANATGKSDFQTGLTAFTHEDQHVTDILGAKTFQGAAAAGAAGDAPSAPGANNTTGGTAEGRAQQIVGALGAAGQSFQPNAQYDGAAANILKQGAAQQAAQQKTACTGGSCPQ